ncbi:hypothetical protein NOVO_01895 [Rickettsiales bacterium Ac37b]|nr:hypothetical protein NOVO_01895 [Rickettsiales bacterium Ac37b]
MLNSLHHNVEIIRPASAINDFKFISTWLLVSIGINIIMWNFSFYSTVYKTVHIYIIQNLIFYLMVKMKFYNYKLIKKAKV